MHLPSYGTGHSARIVTLALTLGKSDSPGPANSPLRMMCDLRLMKRSLFLKARASSYALRVHLRGWREMRGYIEADQNTRGEDWSRPLDMPGSRR